ncbi:MAG: hypothetical protein ACPGED_07830 [Flavobacteriales bacterium]
MKKLALALPVLFLLVGLSSCDKVNEKSFSVQLVKDFTIDLEEGETTYNVEEVVSTLTNAELNDVKESIIGYSVKSLSYKVWEYSGPETATMEADIKFERSTDPTDLVEYAIPSALLADLNATESRTPIDFNQNQLDKLAQYFLSGDELNIKSLGLVSEAPIHMVLQVVMDVEATAEISE